MVRGRPANGHRLSAPSGGPPRRAHRAASQGERVMSAYLSCWISAATALFSQALAGEPQIVEAPEARFAQGTFGFAATFAGNPKGRFAVILDAALLEAPLM